MSDKINKYKEGSIEPKITIIIPTCGDLHSEYIKRLVESIYKHTSGKNYNLLILKNNWRGFSKVINEGIRMFLSDKESDYVFLLNDDTFVMPGWDYHFMKIFESANKENTKLGILGDVFTRLQGDHCAFWAVMISRQCIEECGLLDEKYYNGYEDIEYCERVKKLGYKIYTTKYNFIQHVVSSTIDMLPEDVKKVMDKTNKETFDGYKDLEKEVSNEKTN